MKTEVLGSYAITNTISLQPHKRCVDCPFFEDGVCWCNYLKKKVPWDYNEDCPVIEITIEEACNV